MAKRIVKKDTSTNKIFKSMGAISVRKEGNKAELLFDAAKMPKNVRDAIAPGFAASSASTSNISNNPFDATFFMQPYNYLKAAPHEKIRMAMQYFKVDPLVGKIIELMATFSKEGFKNECEDPKIKEWFDNWCDFVDIELMFKWIFLEYYRSGNVTTMRTLAPYNEDKFKLCAPEYAYGSNKEINLSKLQELTKEIYKANGAAKKTYSKKSIPVGYTVLNPLTVHVSNINGYKDDLFIRENEEVEVFENIGIYKLMLQELPKDLGEVAKKAGVIPLSDKNVRRILRMRQPYEPYGEVMMERAFNAIFEKNKLRQLDMSMVNSAINQIIKVTVGNDQYPATKRSMENVAKAFAGAGKGQAIFWNHTLEIEVIKPDTQVLNVQKYERVNEDIRNAFGISEILTGGGNSKTNFATAYLSLKAFITNLTEGRNDVVRWIVQEYKDIAQAMDFKTYPTPSFNPLSLTDEIAEKQLIMQALDRGIISYESAQSRLGYDPRIERDRREKEIPDVEAGVLGMIGSPYQQAVVDTPKETKKEVSKSDKKKIDTTDEKVNQKNREKNKSGSPQGVPNKGADGRPNTPKGNYPKNRKVAKIKGQAEKIEQL